jgi:pseudoazurin
MKLIKLVGIVLISIIQFSSVYAVEHEVKMLNSGKDGMMVFEPGVLKVAVGDTVKFVPTDAGHNAGSYFLPEGASVWKGEVGKEVSVTLDKEGLYIYECDPHKVMAMVGVIQVGEVKNKEAATKAAKKLAESFSLNKDRLDKYLEILAEKENKTTEEKHKK